ncbi:MAG: hypothetical protein HY876_03320 [Coriobacteriales bacterium]|nr:hypothetical protein [Coriobacteriales bacterium]
MRARLISYGVIAFLLAALLALAACTNQPADTGTNATDGTTTETTGTPTEPPATEQPPAGEGESTAVKALVLERCTVCHDTTRIKQAQHDAAAWEATVERMRGNGAQLSDAEAAAIAKFLAEGGNAQL